VAQAVEAQVAPLRESLQGMNQFFQQLQSQTEGQLTETPGTPAAQDGDFAQEFYNDPQGAVAAEFSRQATPLISQQADTLSTMLIEGERAKIDSQYGEGAWEEVFQPELGPVIDSVKKTDPMRLMNREAISNAVATVVGKNVDKLMERRQANESTLQDSQGDLVNRVTEQVLSQTNLTGGIRRAPNGGEAKLSEDHKEYLEAFFRETGEKPDEQRLATMMNTGGTLEEWQAAQAKLNGGSK
jgi:hypothetical protein